MSRIRDLCLQKEHYTPPHPYPPTQLKALIVSQQDWTKPDGGIVLIKWKHNDGGHKFYWSTLISVNNILKNVQGSDGSLKIIKDCEADNGTAISVAFLYFSQKLKRCCVKAPSVP